MAALPRLMMLPRLRAEAGPGEPTATRWSRATETDCWSPTTGRWRCRLTPARDRQRGGGGRAPDFGAEVPYMSTASPKFGVYLARGDACRTRSRAGCPHGYG